MCATSRVRIENYNELQEVHILFAAMRTVESWLHETAAAAGSGGDIGQPMNDGQHENEDDVMMEGGESDSLSDFDSSSSNDEDDDKEEGQTSDSGDDSWSQHPSSQPQDANPPNTTSTNNNYKAYWIRELIVETKHGHVNTHVFRATVLHQSDLHWVETNQQVAIKRVTWEGIQAGRNGRISEDFVKEIAALQYLSNLCNNNNGNTNDNYDDINGEESSIQSHVLTANTIMANQSHVFIVMPYCAGGDIIQQVGHSPHHRFTEATAKYWFRQMLTGLRTLQNARLCHRDLSPENFIIFDDATLVIDFGMCLRIPYSEDGTTRHLISKQHPCGKLPHMSPEIYRARPFDGHAVDIWATGTVLLFMLTGKRFEGPPLTDGVLDNVEPGELGLSDVAMDLLRRIFRLRPEDRLTLDEICEHQFLQSL